MPPNHPPPKTGLSINSATPELIGSSAGSLQLSKGISNEKPSNSINLRRSISLNESTRLSTLSPSGTGLRDQATPSSSFVRNTQIEPSSSHPPVSRNISATYAGQSSYGNHTYNSYGNMGGMGMMGMGMGMGYPGMYGMGMGMGYSPLMGGPMALLGNINYIILGVGQFITMLGMSSTMFVGMYQSLVNTYQHFETIIRQSSLRRWVQKKCKKSAMFRFIIVLTTMAIVGTASKLVKDVLKSYLQQWGGKSALLTATASS